jgi:hypothetical protein
MKNYTSCFLCLILLLSLNVAAQNKKVEVKDVVKSVTDLFKKKKKDEPEKEKVISLSVMNRDLVFKTVFGTTKVDANNEVIWNYKNTTALTDDQKLVLSVDGQFHTALDNIFYYTDNGVESAVAILFTYKYEVGDNNKVLRAACHMCAPYLGLATFSKQADGNWKLLNSTPLHVSTGSFGNKPGYKFRNLGKDLDALVITSGYGNQGQYEEGVSYLAVNNVIYLTYVLNYTSAESYDGGFSEKGAYSINKEAFETDTPGSAYKTVTLKVTKNNKKQADEVYTFSQSEGLYIKKIVKNKASTAKKSTASKTTAPSKKTTAKSPSTTTPVMPKSPVVKNGNVKSTGTIKMD